MEPMDNTEEVCRENHTRYIPRTGGNLYGDAIRTGFASATGKYTVIMDADGSHDPKEILNFLEVMEQGKTDLVIGSRYCKGGYTDNNFILRFMSWALNVTYRVFFGLKVKDVSDSFRMYKTHQIQQLRFECDNFDIVEEILIKLSYSFDPYIIRELPISFNKRVAGESKRDLVKFIISYITTIRKLLRIKHSTVKGR
jgi:dolichol-phosphate mannosyltransferase